MRATFSRTSASSRCSAMRLASRSKHHMVVVAAGCPPGLLALWATAPARGARARAGSHAPCGPRGAALLPSSRRPLGRRGEPSGASRSSRGGRTCTRLPRWPRPRLWRRLVTCPNSGHKESHKSSRACLLRTVGFARRRCAGPSAPQRGRSRGQGSPPPLGLGVELAAGSRRGRGPTELSGRSFAEAGRGRRELVGRDCDAIGYIGGEPPGGASWLPPSLVDITARRCGSWWRSFGEREGFCIAQCPAAHWTTRRTPPIDCKVLVSLRGTAEGKVGHWF